MSNNIAISISTQPKTGYIQCYSIAEGSLPYGLVFISRKKSKGFSYGLLSKARYFLRENGFVNNCGIKRLYIKIEENK